MNPWRTVVRGAVQVLLLTITVAAVAATALVVVMLAVGEPIDDRSTVLGILLAALVGAAAWPWARRLVEASVARLRRGAGAAEDPLRAFQQPGSREVPIDELLVQMAESLVRASSVERVEVWRPVGGTTLRRSVSVPVSPQRDLELPAASARVLASGGVVSSGWCEMWWPDLLGALVAHGRQTDLRVVPATHAGELLGVLVLVRSGAERFGPTDDVALAELGGRLGLVLRNRKLDATLEDTLADLRRTNAELRASRVRLVATADAERRRLERDLHDGAQQHLVAFAVDLRLAADEIAADPSIASERFARLGEGVKEAIAELRSLAHGIYPPLLMDQGLVEALRVSARRSASPVAVTGEGVGRFAPEVEATAYFCSMEALQNATKHAPGAPVRISLARSDGALQIVVDDDGPGFDPRAVQPGHGLGNMADRLGAAGGSLAVGRSASGGARIAVTLPVAAS